MRIFDGGDEVDSLESVKQEKDFFLITVFDNRGKCQFTLPRGAYLALCRIGMQELRDDEVNAMADADKIAMEANKRALLNLLPARKEGE